LVKLVTGSNKDRYAALLDGMFKDRKRVFVDRLKWDVPVVDGVYERDQYDHDQAVYLIAADPESGGHLGSMRLLSTTGPHLLKEVFPELCEGEMPMGEDVWEVTRLCTAPGLKHIDPREVRRQLSVAMIEFALLYGVSRLTFLTHMEYISRLLGIGWECRPLGLPKEVAGQLVGAMEISITQATLQTVRMVLHGRKTPILELIGIADAA
jgi:acyl-homoserine lactone synthase